LESEPADVNTEENVARIAQAIQDTIEGELADLQDKDEQEA
jgi:hypothetical protein